jgi:long-subunit fatty acid transport protein
MKLLNINHITKTLIGVIFLFGSGNAMAQENQGADFADRIHFGGGLGLSFGSGYTNITVAPSAIYDFNQYFSAGLGLQGSYVRDKNFYESYIYGPSLIVLGNPIPEIQLSAELEQLRVNLDYDDNFGGGSDNFWNTALFLGAGYRMENVTVGARYNVLHDSNKNVYSDAFMPFVRIYF